MPSRASLSVSCILPFLPSFSSLPVDLEHLDVEDQRRSPRNLRGRTHRAVAEVRGDLEPPLLPDAHRVEALVPPLDDLAGPEHELEGVAATCLEVVWLVLVGFFGGRVRDGSKKKVSGGVLKKKSSSSFSL